MATAMAPSNAKSGPRVESLRRRGPPSHSRIRPTSTLLTIDHQLCTILGITGVGMCIAGGRRANNMRTPHPRTDPLDVAPPVMHTSTPARTGPMSWLSTDCTTPITEMDPSRKRFFCKKVCAQTVADRVARGRLRRRSDLAPTTPARAAAFYSGIPGCGIPLQAGRPTAAPTRRSRREREREKGNLPA